MSGNERAWVDGLRSGDVACFDAVYHAYSPRLRAFLRAMCGRADIADELLQETFLRLARRSPDLAEDTRLGAWLYTVPRNLAHSHNRWRWLDASRLVEIGRSAMGEETDQQVQQERRDHDQRDVAHQPLPERALLRSLGRGGATGFAAAVGKLACHRVGMPEEVRLGS